MNAFQKVLLRLSIKNVVYLVAHSAYGILYTYFITTFFEIMPYGPGLNCVGIKFKCNKGEFSNAMRKSAFGVGYYEVFYLYMPYTRMH